MQFKIDPPPEQKKAQEKASRGLQSIELKESQIDAKKVVIVGLKIPFWDIVSLMVKSAFAILPATFISFFLWRILIFILNSY